MTMTPAVVVDAKEAGATVIDESPLSEDSDMDVDSSSSSNNNNNQARYLGDGVREGPELCNGSADGKINSRVGGAAAAAAAPSSSQRGRQPTRDAETLLLLHPKKQYDPSDVLTAYRSRSLSAGRRSRPRPAFDIVQDVYDRIGVTYRRGEAIGGAAGPRIAAGTTAAAVPSDSAAVSSSAESSAVPATAKTTTTDPHSSKAKADSSPTTTTSTTPSRIYRAQGSTVSSPLREKFQKRYFPRSAAVSAAAAASRTGGTTAASPRGREALLETLERRRSRSLSRTGTAKKATATAATSTTVSSKSSALALPSTLALSPSNAVGSGAVAEAAKSRAAWPPSPRQQSDPTTSPTHSASAGSLLLKKKQGPFESPVVVPADNIADAPTTAVGAETSSDATADDLAGIMPSVKDRMAIFGGNSKTSPAPAPASKSKAKAKANPRDYPPKIDIYATSQTPPPPPPRTSASVEDMEDEKKDDSVGHYDAIVRANIAKRFDGGAAAVAPGVGSSHSSGGGGSRHSKNSTPNANNFNPQVSPYRTAPLLANFTPAEPYNTTATRNLSTTSPAPKQVAQQRIGIKYTPVIEIPVDETGAALSGNDNSSFVSSLGADETAIITRQHPAGAGSRKWQLQTSPTAAAAPPLQVDRGQHRYGGAGNNASPGSAPTGPGGPAAHRPSTLTTDLMENMVEERLQSHLAALEAHMENQLRSATLQLERQMTSRLTALEDKISALVQAQQQLLLAASATGDSNPSRGSYSAGARRGW